MIRRRNFIVFCTLAIAPAFLIYTVLILYPLVQGLLLSLYDTSSLSADKVFVGLKHYKALLEEDSLVQAFLNDMFLGVWRMVAVMILSFFFAEVLSRMKIREKEFYKVIFFFPNVLSIVVISILWVFIYNPNFGILNEILKMIGLDTLAKPWLSDFDTVLWALIPPSVWATVGFYLIIFIAAIQGIDPSYYEAAKVDGASYFKQLTSITIPLVWNHVKIAVILLVIGNFGSNFSIVNIMTGGGPAGTTEVMQHILYKEAFESHNFGYAAMIGVLMTLIAAVYTLIMNKLFKRESIEY
ncbi:carbohydrate ABC transporter permease [Paenibacillus agaridevorans]|uniref:carbohydrate ABC transporter permease n=1 Tax=Paenibacillus agaridevorans TaxID=171404 RepID=UPI001BE48A01|nr:sugar ABC transporter permease [Paenibacillus agaridevorans]